MTRHPGRLACTCVAVVMWVTVAPARAVDTGGGDASIGANFTSGGINVGGSQGVPGGGQGGTTQDVSATAHPRSQTTLTPACPGNDPNVGGAYDLSCQTLVSGCQAAGLGPGPMTWIWSRPIDPAGGATGPWVRTGLACNVPAAVVAAANPRPVLTLQAIRQAFREVRFAKPVVRIQPEGNVTLVNLPTYYRVQWPAEGVEPAEVATVQLLGRSVRIRPLGRSFVYDFGDGAHAGPTEDAGGVYPDGGVRHTYDKPGAAGVSVAATYGGEFSVDGGPWQQVGDTVQIAGPATGLRVREGRARLEAG